MIFKNTKEWLEEANPKQVEVETIQKWINEEIEEFKEALWNNDKQEMIDAIVDANIFLANLPYFYDLDIEKIEEMITQVNLSNWSKFCKTEEEAIETKNAYSRGTHPNKIGELIDTYISKGKNFWIVRKTDDNKIMKSINFKEPNEFRGSN